MINITRKIKNILIATGIYISIVTVGYSAAISEENTNVLDNCVDWVYDEMFFSNTTTSDIEYCLVDGMDVNRSTTISGYTILHTAIERDASLAMIRMLIEYGADVNAQTGYGWTPLHIAVLYNTNYQIVQALIDAGANVNIVDRHGWSPFEMVFDGYFDVSDESRRIIINDGAF